MGSWKDTETREGGEGAGCSPFRLEGWRGSDPSLCPPAHRCLRMASAVSLRSSSDGRTARAPEASMLTLRPRLPETSLSYFLKLWDEPYPPAFLRGDPSFCSLYVSCVQAPALTWTRVSAHAGEHGALGFLREPLSPSLPARPQRLHSPCLRSEPSPPLSALGQLLPR